MRAIHLLVAFLILAIPVVLWPRSPPFVGSPVARPTCFWVQETGGARCGAQPAPSPKAPARVAAPGGPPGGNPAPLAEPASPGGGRPQPAGRIRGARPLPPGDEGVPGRGVR